MASNFPSSLDSFTNPSSSDAMDSVSVPHASQHSDLNDAVEALQAKVGADSSGVTSSLDYKVAQLETNVAGLVTGKILQVVSTAKTDTWSGTVTGSAFSSNITGLEVTITPTSATSKVLIICLLHATHNNYGQANYRLVRNGTAVGVADAAGTRPQLTSGLQPADTTAGTATPVMNMGAHYLDSPASTSALTYGVQLYGINPTATMYVNRTQNDGDSPSRGRYVSTITVMEVSA
jgi:hypothetical protein